MKKDKLLRALIKEILLNEDDGGGVDVESPGAQDTIPQLDNQGNPKFSSSSHSSFSASSGHGASGGTSDWLYGNLKTVAQPAIAGAKDVGKSVAKAGMQAASVAWLLNNPWTASMMGDKWLQNYLDTAEKGSTSEIGINTIKNALMSQAQIFGGLTLPAIAAGANALQITTLLSTLPTIINKLRQHRDIFPFYNTIFDNMTKIYNSTPNIPQGVKDLFTVDKNNKAAIDNYIYAEFNKALRNKQSSSPIAGNVIQIEKEALKILKNQNVRDENDLIRNLTKAGVDQDSATRLSNFIFFAAGRRQPPSGKQQITKKPQKA
jgi:hypothetical protein